MSYSILGEPGRCSESPLPGPEAYATDVLAVNDVIKRPDASNDARIRTGRGQMGMARVTGSCSSPTGSCEDGLQTPWGSAMFSHTLGVCDAESCHTILPRWRQPSEPDLGNTSVGKRHSHCIASMLA